MKYVDEYRDQEAAGKLAAAIARTVTRPWTIMEVCGGQTHSIVKYGLDEVLPAGLELVHGPGCPVRVTGSRGDLLALKARGRDVRVVYSPLDAVQIAAAHPDRQVVFFAIGFET